MCVRACVRVCVRACVRACVCHIHTLQMQSLTTDCRTFRPRRLHHLCTKKFCLQLTKVIRGTGAYLVHLVAMYT